MVLDNTTSENNKTISEILKQIKPPDKKTQYENKMHQELLCSIKPLTKSDRENKLIVYRSVSIPYELLMDLTDRPETIHEFAQGFNNFYFIEYKNNPKMFIIYQLSKTKKTFSKLYEYSISITCD